MNRIRTYSNVIGFDDMPFPRSHRGDVTIVGTVFAGLRFEGVLTGRIRRDGADAADNISELIENSKFSDHIQLVMLQGIALGGFNVVDIRSLHQRLQRPVLAVARRKPDMNAVRNALLTQTPGGEKKWKIIEKTGDMEPAEKVFVQRAGISLKAAGEVIRKFAVYSNIPEPLRAAHIIAAGIGRGESGGRV